MDKLENFFVAVDYLDSVEDPAIVHEYFSVFMERATGRHIIVPDSLYLDYCFDNNYEEELKI